jgi:hypothetical protein
LEQVLGGGNGVDWDVDAIRTGGDAFLYESIPDDDPLRQATKKAILDGTIGISVRDLSEDEIKGICALRSGRFAQEGATHHVTECPKKNLGAVVVGLVLSRETIFKNHLNATANRLHEAHLGTGEFQLFVYSHTHFTEAAYSPFQHTASQWTPVVMNTGAWQRTIDEQQLGSIMAKRNMSAKNVLKLDPEDLPPCYPFIIVSPNQQKPRGELLYWVRSGATWVTSDRCEWDP